MTSVLSLESMIGPDDVVQVDSSMKVTATLHWSEAITKVFDKKAYVLLDRSNGEVLRSLYQVNAKPLVIALNMYVPEPKAIKMGFDDHVAKSKILIRDDWTCQYCNKYGNTIDHIMPKSRGGLNTWGNLCVACKKCNGLKSNMTPQEVGFKVPKIPKIFIPPRGAESRLQNALYADLQNMVG